MRKIIFHSTDLIAEYRLMYVLRKNLMAHLLELDKYNVRH